MKKDDSGWDRNKERSRAGATEDRGTVTLVNARYLLACKPHTEFIYCIISHSYSNKTRVLVKSKNY